jgi:hypothetical protein
MARKDADNAANDPNCLAYQEALKAGQFKEMTPGDYVAYFEGKLIASGPRDKVLEEIRGKGAMLHQVNHPEEIIDIPTVFHFRSPRIVRKT